MKKVEAIVRPHRFDTVQERLRELGIEEMTTYELVTGMNDNAAEDPARPTRVELIVDDNMVDAVIRALTGRG